MTTGRINQVTIVNANKGPLWRLPLVAQRKRFFVTVVMALSPEGPRGPTGSAPPGAAPAAWPQEPQLASAIPFQVPQGAVG